jgi:hypothetical protein
VYNKEFLLPGTGLNILLGSNNGVMRNNCLLIVNGKKGTK